MSKKAYVASIVVAVFVCAGSVLALHPHKQVVANTSQSWPCGYQQSCHSGSISIDTPQTPVDTTPAPAPTPQPSPTKATVTPNNQDQCNSIASAQKADLDSLNAQVVAQLEVMKTIIGNSSLNSSILSRGGSINQILTQNQINETFNQASDNANTLIAQYNTDNNNFHNQLLGAQCFDILKAQLNG